MENETKEEMKIQYNWNNILTVSGIVLAAIIVIVVASQLVTNYQTKNPPTEQPSPTMAQDTTSGKLDIQDEVVGTGQEVKSGDTVSVNYIGTLLDGTEFDNSYKRGQPFEFKVGAGQVIPGWDQGLIGMKVGGKRKLTIPPDLAYGDKSPSPQIPANSTLVFEIELVSIK